MKKRLKILSLFLPATCLMVSFTITNVENGIHKRTVFSSLTDSSTASQWIRVRPFNLGLIPPSSGVQFYQDGIVFLSSTKYEVKMTDNQISFGKPDARYAKISDTIPGDLKAFSTSLPFPYPCEAMTFTSEYDTLYYTRYSVKEGVEKIYKATDTKGGSWSFVDTPESFCTGKSSYNHPALSADGKLIVFASNRTGSIGGMDLFASIKKNGIWSEPVNLGDAVNSTYNEVSPFLDQENNLFFSSDSPQGFGGYDIYVCKFKGNTWEKPINLSTPVNTKDDDVAFTISRKTGKTAFYTVSQSSGSKTRKPFVVTMSESRPDTLLSLSQFFTRPDISQMVILALEPAVQATDNATETASVTRGAKDTITYRVEFMTSFNPRTRQNIAINGKDYKVFEFLYSGAYRMCVGEFSLITDAIELRNTMRGSGYPRANVVVFKNNLISLDTELLKEPPTAGNEMKDQKQNIQPTGTVTSGVTLVVANPRKELTTSDTKNANTSNPAVITSPDKKDAVIYRVQILTSNTAKGSYRITVGKDVYDSFEYFYNGAYRTCVGAYSTLQPAVEFQKLCRQSGYSQAFVIAFKNNVRSTDPSLFR